MISRYEATLNGIAMSTISPDIYIQDIQYQPPRITNTSITIANRQGSNINKRYTDKASVAIYFEIRAYSIAQRQAVCSKIVNWAKKGGILRINDRIWQRLRCICETFPVITSVRNWTESLQIVFSAYDLPYWESVTPSELQLSGTTGSGTLYVPGTYDSSLVEVTAVAGGSLSSISFTANDYTLSLTGLSVSSGQMIKIRYNDRMIQSIKVGNTSLLTKRSGADDLKALCGETNSFQFTANVTTDVTFSTRGLWI